MTGRSGNSGPGGVEALYPFLYAEDGDVEAVLAEVTKSTAAKAREIVMLREMIAGQYAARMAECAAAMARSFAEGGKLLTFGNGGSSTDAQAIAYAFLRPATGLPLPAISLTSDAAVITALGNDVAFDIVFSRQLSALGRKHDVAFGVSTSGNSANLLKAFEEANRRGLLTVGLAGYDGGKMAEAGTIDFLFVVPSHSVHRIQEAQTTIYHLLWELVR
ncbi:MAG: D-sedoheptulose-7-phosphate isomerase, partial [Candidatus Binataceae bacterium]